MATVDDDNIPYENWSDNITVNSEIEYDSYKALNVFDPISVTNEKHLWHRGFPIQLTNERELSLNWRGGISWAVGHRMFGGNEWK